MLAIELTFIAGRFHATPWGRNVNEGVPEWPPSPYRLIRSLYDVWRRKLPDWPESRVMPVLASLASEPPIFHLPAATASHTRSFLSENDVEVTKKQLIFDAFVVVSKRASVLIKWPACNLDEKLRQDLDRMLALMNYLGRSESWVAARTVPDVDGVNWNCRPSDGSPYVEDFEPLRVACPIPALTYAADPHKQKAKGKKNKSVELGWMDAIAWSTGDLHASHLSVPPAFQYVTYMRPARCFDLIPIRKAQEPETEINGVIYALESKVAPRVTDTLEISERVRSKLMGIHKRIVSDPRKVSPKFSGKETNGEPRKGHQHIYVLPIDHDQDGWLDRLLIFCKVPFNQEEIAALDRLDRLWQPDGKPDIHLVPLKWGRSEDLLESGSRTSFVSTTPFVPPRHYRKGRGPLMEWLAAEVRREAVNHGLPEPIEVTPLPRLSSQGGRDFRWLEFRRNRKGDQPTIGYGFKISFPESIGVPIALGYGAHFGLGQFKPAPV